jgi:hypothetical protein
MKKGVRKNHQTSPYYGLSKNMMELLDLWCLLLGNSLVYKRSIKIRSIENLAGLSTGKWVQKHAMYH